MTALRTAAAWLPPVFFVQNNYVERLTVPVALYARERGVALEDRSTSASFDPDACDIDWSQYGVVLPYGSVQFIRKLKASSLGRFVLHDEACFAASNWMPRFGENALNSAGGVVPAGKVAERLATGAMHLRPDKVDKAFTGGVFGVEGWNAQRAERAINDDLACWMSPVSWIETEWRCWLVGGKIVGISLYRQDGQMALAREFSHDVYAAAERLASIYLPAPCVVLDVARVGDQYKVIEFNPIHCSGWYAADVHKVLSAWLAWTEEHLV